MPSYKSIEVDCPICGPHDQLVERALEHEEARCDKCGELADVLLSAPLVQTINFKNADFGARQKERLDKRSSEWSRTKGKDEKVYRTEQMIKKNTT